MEIGRTLVSISLLLVISVSLVFGLKGALQSGFESMHIFSKYKDADCERRARGNLYGIFMCSPVVLLSVKKNASELMDEHTGWAVAVEL